MSESTTKATINNLNQNIHHMSEKLCEDILQRTNR